MLDIAFPDNLTSLYIQETSLREKALAMLTGKYDSFLHLNAIERTISLAKIMVEYPDDGEDFKVIKMLSIRMFNAFGASLTLMFAGYHQNSALIMRDTLETFFLLDLFRSDRQQIETWRFADNKMMKEKFSPVAVRKFLDQRDGVDSRKRETIYKMFCELAAHPNMHSQHMLRPEKGGDIVIGPWMEITALEAGIAELGRLGIQAGEIMNAFLPKGWDRDEVRLSFAVIKKQWIETFYKWPEV